MKNKQKREQTANTPDYIHQYIVKRVGGQKQKVAVFVGRKSAHGSIKIGWSKANISAGDKFDKKFGVKLALERTKAEFIELPPSICIDAQNFARRCQKYFK